jgi:hypothetical protein
MFLYPDGTSKLLTLTGFVEKFEVELCDSIRIELASGSVAVGAGEFCAGAGL